MFVLRAIERGVNRVFSNQRDSETRANANAVVQPRLEPRVQAVGLLNINLGNINYELGNNLVVYKEIEKFNGIIDTTHFDELLSRYPCQGSQKQLMSAELAMREYRVAKPGKKQLACYCRVQSALLLAHRFQQLEQPQPTMQDIQRMLARREEIERQLAES